MVKERAKIDIYALLLSNTAALIMALNGMAYWGIAIQGVLYIGLGTFLRWYYSPWRPTFSFNLQPLREMFPFSARLLLTNLFSQMSTNIFSILLGKFYTVQQVGYYSQGYKWMNMGGEFYHGNDIRSSPAGICSSLLREGEASTGFKKDDPFYGFYIFSIDVWHGVGRK